MNMNMIATTSEQSQRLLRCGVSADTADMHYFKDILSVGHLVWDTPFPKKIFPAWSLSRLLELLPKEIYDESGDGFYFSLAKEFPLSEEYGAAYIPCWYKGDSIVRKRDNCPIEACVQLIEWLAANGYKLNDCPCQEKGGIEQ